MKISAFVFVALLSFTFSSGSIAAEVANQIFAPGKWKMENFELVRSSRWPDHAGKWLQGPDFIFNTTPSDASAPEMLNPRAGETYTAMVWNKPLSGDVKITMSSSFDFRMAPSIVIAKELREVNGVKQFGEHFEIVLFDQGLNVWHHWFENGKQVWRKAAFLNAAFAPLVKHTMTVELKQTHRGLLITVSCGGQQFGYLEPTAPQANYYVGLVACEGINRFYDFKVEQ